MGREFIRHRPDRDLSLMFPSKPHSEQTACEVQARLNEFLRNCKGHRGHVSQHTVTAVTSLGGAVDCSMSPVKGSVGCRRYHTGQGQGMLERALVGNAQAPQHSRSEQNVKWSVKCEVC